MYETLLRSLTRAPAVSAAATDADSLSASVADWALGNIPAAAGYSWGQVFRTIELVADTIAAYPPGTQITLTGHSRECLEMSDHIARGTSDAG